MAAHLYESIMCTTHDEHFHSLTSINRILILNVYLIFIDYWLTSFKTILGGFIFSTITKVDHIPSIAKASCYLTCIKHAFKHPQTRTHLYRESCGQTDTRQTDRHTHTLMQRTMQPDRQTDTHTDTHTRTHAPNTFAKNLIDRHAHRHTHTH